MMRRCYDPKTKSYERYGGAGLRVCQEWHKYESFREWAMSNGYEETKTIDRFPNRAGGYEPSNCRWATWHEQARNKDCVITVEYRGETRLFSRTKNRFYSGLTPEQIFDPDERLDMPSGEKAPGAKLKDSEVIAMRVKRLSGFALDELAEEYGVTRSAVDLACRGVTFSHLPNIVPKQRLRQPGA